MKIIKQKDLAHRLGLVPSHLHYILKGERRPSSKAAVRLERRSGVGRMVWLYGTNKEIRKELERSFGKINFGRGRVPTEEKK